MDSFAQQRKNAAGKVRAELAKPVPVDEYDIGDDRFDPWELFPALYGSYSKAFDDMALDVLRALNLASRDRWDECHAQMRSETLAHEMFREMLCTAELCDYGTSPRVCFATTEFRELLPDLIERWEDYSRIRWAPPNTNPGAANEG